MTPKVPEKNQDFNYVLTTRSQSSNEIFFNAIVRLY